MSLPDLITHVIIEDTNRKKCVVARAKTLSTKANMVDDKPTPKWYEKKLDYKKKYNYKFSHPNGTNSTFKKNGNFFVCGKPTPNAPQCKHRAKNDNPSKVDIAEGEDTIIVVVSQVNIVTNVNKSLADSRATKLMCKQKRVYLLHKCGGWRRKSLSR